MQHHHKIQFNTILLIILSLGFFFFMFSTLVFAAEHPPTKFTPTVWIPGLEGFNEKTTIPEYINAVYLLIISVAALYGVIKIAIAGVKYSLTDVVTDKESAKKDLKGVVFGLIILLVPYIVLYQINPDLVNLNVLQGAPRVNTSVSEQTRAAQNATIQDFEVPEGVELFSCNPPHDYRACLAPCERQAGTVVEFGSGGDIARYRCVSSGVASST